MPDPVKTINFGQGIAAYNATPPVYNDREIGGLQLTSDGSLKVSGGVGGGGDATAAKQDTGNTSLASIDTKTPSLGQALAASSVPVVLTAAQITTLTPPAAIIGFATSAKQDNLLTELQLKADLTETQPVSLASVPSHAVTNAGTFAVQADTELTTDDLDTGVGTDARAVVGLVGSASGGGALIPGSATDGLLVNLGANNDISGTVTANLAAGTNNIGDVDVVTLPALPAGTNNIGDVDILTIAAGDNNIGNVDIVTLPALAAGTNNIGDVDIVTMPTVTVNAHAVTNAGTFAVQESGAALTALQLIDNAISGAGFNITQLGGVNVSMGTGVRDTGTQRVTIATDDVVPVSGTITDETVATATLANVSASATSVTSLVSSALRKAAYFFNDSSSFAYLKFGAVASATSFTVKIPPFSFYEIPQPVYTGIIDMIHDSATGTMRVTSL